MKTSARICFGLAYLIIAALAAVTIRRMIAGTEGFFTYIIDDPYIHLAMSEEILRGNYGVNGNEVAAASSSILFPFLFAPGAPFWFHDKLPLVFNFVCLFVTLEAARRLLAHLGFLATTAGAAASALLLVMFAIFTFTFGVVFTGMEHSAHIAAVAVSIYGLAVFLDRGRAPWWFVVAVIAGPLFRFEGLALSLSICGVMALRGAWRPFLVSVVLIAVSVGGFMAFLVSLGLPPLPSSVLMKSGAAATGTEGKAVTFVVALLKNAAKMRLHPTGIVLGLIAAAILAAFVLRPDWRRFPLGSKPLMGLAVGGMIVGHALGGSFGWFERYEIYALVGALLGCVYLGRDAIADLLRRPYGALQALVVGCVLLGVVGARYAFATVNDIPLGAQNMYQQNYLMHRFLVDFYKRPAALNDLGWTSYRNPYPVLDLWGLGSDKARKLRQSGDMEGVVRLVTDAKIGLVMGYTGMVGDEWPAGWTIVGRMHLGVQKLTPLYSWIEFVATSEQAAGPIREQLRAFARTVPAGVKVEIFEAGQAAPAVTPSMMR